MIKLGDALLKLGVDDKELKKGLDGVEQKLNKVGKAAMGMGLAITTALVGATIAAAKFGDEIAKMAKRTGLGTVALSELRYMADLSGTSLEGLETGIRRMQRVIIDASAGMSTAVRAFERLGLSIEDVLALSPEEQFYTIAKALADIHDPTMRAAVAQEVFGRAGTQLLPMLAEGAAGLEALREEAHEYGRIIDEEAAAKSEEFMDALERLKKSFGGIVDVIGVELMPVITELLEDKIIPAIHAVIDWMKENEGLVKSLFKVGGVLLGAGGVIFAIGKVIKVVQALKVALIAMHAFMGPKGWAILAASAGIAAGAIAGAKVLEPDDLPEMPEYEDLEDMQHGGIVPGPRGKPVPIIAHGGEEFLGVDRGAPMGMTVNLGLLPGDDVTLRKVAKLFKDVLGEDSRRQQFGQVNEGYYYGRSSV